MKSAYNEDMEAVKAIFKLWHEKGFISNKERLKVTGQNHYNHYFPGKMKIYRWKKEDEN
jgi:hypothetical protein